jgi:hypothetical protein
METSTCSPTRTTTLHPIVMAANDIKLLEFYSDDLEEPFRIFLSLENTPTSILEKSDIIEAKR